MKNKWYMVNDQMVNINDISAELLLSYLYPELTGKWMPRHAGTFYRNYNSDVMTVYPDEPTVVLSRDGFVQLLPQGLFAGEDSRRMKMLQDAFLPLDAYWFNARLRTELKVSQILADKLNFILSEYFRFDLAAETNPYVRQVAVMLPFVRTRRGDFAFIRDILASLVRCPVEQTVGRYSDTDTTVSWLPRLRYTLCIPDLTPEEYRSRMTELEPLFSFIREWLIPMEVVCEFVIRDTHPHTVANALTLGYNTQL